MDQDKMIADYLDLSLAKAIEYWCAPPDKSRELDIVADRQTYEYLYKKEARR